MMNVILRICKSLSLNLCLTFFDTIVSTNASNVTERFLGYARFVYLMWLTAVV